jgi:DeoR/GlpR family transcriptional regulator of sugar metabolism
MSNSDEEEKIFVEERRNRIVELLSSKHKASVSELSQQFKVGEATIRRDLHELEQRGLVLRTHGGVLLMDSASSEAPLKERETQHKEEKERIANFIAQFIRNGESIMIDVGTTTMQIAKALRPKRNLVVVTNFPALAAEMSNTGGNQVILTGGELRETSGSLVGPLAVHSIRQFRVDRVILGMSAIMPDEGFFTVNPSEAEVKRGMMQCGKDVIVAMDSSKIGKITLSFVSDFSMVGKVITDVGASAEDIEKMTRHGIEVVTV